MFKLAAIALADLLLPTILLAQGATSPVRLVCHEAFNSDWVSSPTQKGKPLNVIIHFITIDLGAKTAVVDDNANYNLTLFDGNFYQIELNTGLGAATAQTISIDRRDGFLDILNMSIQGTNVSVKSQAFGMCGTPTPKY
jgi:hypothetical protein